MTKLYCADCGIEMELGDESCIESACVCLDCAKYYDEEEDE